MNSKVVIFAALCVHAAFAARMLKKDLLAAPPPLYEYSWFPISAPVLAPVLAPEPALESALESALEPAPFGFASILPDSGSYGTYGHDPATAPTASEPAGLPLALNLLAPEPSGSIGVAVQPGTYAASPMDEITFATT